MQNESNFPSSLTVGFKLTRKKTALLLSMDTQTRACKENGSVLNLDLRKTFEWRASGSWPTLWGSHVLSQAPERPRLVDRRVSGSPKVMAPGEAIPPEPSGGLAVDFFSSVFFGWSSHIWNPDHSRSFGIWSQCKQSCFYLEIPSTVLFLFIFTWSVYFNQSFHNMQKPSPWLSVLISWSVA